jgi:3-deoxy-manno-octulosonate cytidylyltransferase (CMP-KDO synthetase)
VYIYTHETLQQLTAIPQTDLEKIEKLEQLRALESGININVTIVDDYHSLSVDTPADLEKAQTLFKR